MSVAIIVGEHRCSMVRPPDAVRMTRLEVAYFRPVDLSPYAFTQSQVKCLDCGETVPFDLIYDVKVQKTVSVHLSA